MKKKKGSPAPPSSDNGAWSPTPTAEKEEEEEEEEAVVVEEEEPTDLSVVLGSDPTTTTTKARSQGSPLSKEQMEDTRNYRRLRLRSNWACSLGTLAVTLLSAVVLWSIVQSYRERQCDAKGCRMSRMSPVYLKAKDFDTEHTRFASKYSLYLYREHGVDEDYPVRYSFSPLANR